MTVEEELTLNISGALDSVSTLESAVENLSVPVEIGADTSSAEEQLSLFEDSVPTPIVEVGADTSEAEAEIAEIEGSEPEVVVGVTVDGADDAQSQIDGLSDSIDKSGASGKEAAGEMLGLSSGLEAVGAASVAGGGGLGGMSGGLAGLTGASAGATAGVAAVAVGIGVAANAAIEAQDAQDIYNRALGDMTTELDFIDIGGFSGSLEDLAINLGSSDEALKLATARLVTFGKSSGAADADIVKTTESMLVLGANAFSLNPALGSVDQAVIGLSAGLGRGGRALKNFGLDISSADIVSRALADTGKQTADQLTQFERQTAGAAIAMERYGDTLGGNILARQEDLSVKLEATKQKFGEATETIGAAFIPAIEDAADSVSSLADILNQGLTTDGGTSLLDILGQVPQALRDNAPGVQGFRLGLDNVKSGIDLLGLGTEKTKQDVNLFGDALESITTPTTTFNTSLGLSEAALQGLASIAITSGEQINKALLDATDITQANQNLADFRDSYEDYNNAIVAARLEGNTEILGILLAAGPQEGQAMADAMNAASAEERKALETNIQQTNDVVDAGLVASNSVIESGTQTMVETAVSRLTPLPTLVEETLAPLPPVADTAATNTTNAFGGALGLVGKINTEVGNTVTAFSGAAPQMNAQGQAAGAAGTTGVVSGFGDLVGQVETLGGSAGEGMARGLESRAERARQAAADMADEVVGVIRRIFNSSSPSKVTTLLGESVADGLVVGMESHTSLVANAADSLANAAIPDVLSQAAGVVNGAAVGGNAIQVIVQVESAGDDNAARRFGSIVGESAATVIERNQAAMQIRAGSGA